MLATRAEKMREAFLKAIPFHRFAKPEEIADAIAENRRTAEQWRELYPFIEFSPAA